MIFGAHVIIYSKDAEADRNFLRNVLGLPHVDAGHGWLIFALPPAEAAVHPAEENGRHEIFAGNRSVNLASSEHSLKLVAEHVSADIQHDLDSVGIAKTAREEKTRKRDEMMKKKAEDERMAKLYREHILKEAPIPTGFVPLNTLGIPSAPVAKKQEREEVGSFGD